MFDIHRLKIFTLVAEHKSYSQAAHAIYLTQPTVSQHMAALEKHFGLVLFDRVGKEVHLTRGGELLYRYALQIIGMADEAVQALEHFKGKKSGHLVVGASTIPGEFVLPRLLGQFKEQFPGLRNTIRIADTGEVLDLLMNGQIELGVVGAKISKDSLRFVRFLKDELVLIVPSQHRWGQAGEITVSELVTEPFVMRESGSGTRIVLEQQLQKSGLLPDMLNVFAEVGSTTAVKEAVRSGLGVSIISRRAVEDEMRLKTFAIVKIRDLSISRFFYIVQHKKRTPSPLCKAFTRFLQSCIVSDLSS